MQGGNISPSTGTRKVGVVWSKIWTGILGIGGHHTVLDNLSPKAVVSMTQSLLFLLIHHPEDFEKRCRLLLSEAVFIVFIWQNICHPLDFFKEAGLWDAWSEDPPQHSTMLMASQVWLPWQVWRGTFCSCPPIHSYPSPNQRVRHLTSESPT